MPRHLPSDQFQRRGGRVTFVHVDDARLDTQRLEQLHAADAQQRVLRQPDLPVALVETGRDETLLRRVLRQVGVEQEERCLADIQYSCCQPPASTRWWK